MRECGHRQGFRSVEIAEFCPTTKKENLGQIPGRWLLTQMVVKELRNLPQISFFIMDKTRFNDVF